MSISDFLDDTRLAAGDLAAFAGDLVEPTLRLGVTGLSGSGKTVFVTALVHNLVASGRLPQFGPLAEGRLLRAYLRPQPDDAVARFAYEDNLQAILEERRWPPGTRRISQLRLRIDFTPDSFWSRRLGRGHLNIDIVDYPGEWLLDLPLLSTSYGEWSAATLALSQAGARAEAAAEWHARLGTFDPDAPADERHAEQAAGLFTDYLKACRHQRLSLSALPPGRFLMPGDMAGSPALTFAPLPPPAGGAPVAGSLWALMERRFESYKKLVVKPFFRDHFARLDRQIVLVDALAALNAGPEAMRDLELALSEILACFRPGANSWLSRIVGRRIDKILFAATKADHLHHTSHDRLEAVLRRLTDRAIARAQFAGAEVEAMALAAVRATREAIAKQRSDELACIVGTPRKGEVIDGKSFDGESETAIFPGDLPEDPNALLKGRAGLDEALHFVTFRPPPPAPGGAGDPVLPHIRLDRAMNFLFADRLR